MHERRTVNRVMNHVTVHGVMNNHRHRKRWQQRQRREESHRHLHGAGLGDRRPANEEQRGDQGTSGVATHVHALLRPV
jgi:hypothetical protein